MHSNIFGSAPKQEISPESLESKEQFPIVDTKVVLEFFRHGNKARVDVPDHEIPLSEKGRAQAGTKGKDLHPQAGVALGWGSPRLRTQETAYRVMLADNDMTSAMSLEEMKAKVKEEMGGVGKKMIEDERLNFTVDGVVGQAAEKAYAEGRYLEWLLKESDTLALETKDTGSSVAIRLASNIAEICKRYVDVGKNFNRLVAGINKYEDQGNQLERYLGTHQGVMESFVAKVLGKTKGAEERDRFFAAVGAAGFSETQGVRVVVNNHGSEQYIVFEYPVKEGEELKKETVQFGQEVLDSIIDERKAFEAAIEGPTA